MKCYLITVDIEAHTDEPELLEAIIRGIVAQGIVERDASGQLQAFATLRILQRPVEALSDHELRLRRMEEDRLRLTHRIVEERVAYTARVEQLPLPGLERSAA